MCRQKLRNEVPAARNLALSCHPPAARRSCGKRPTLHDFLKVQFHSISGSLVHGRISGGSPGKKHSPYWSLHVEDGAIYCRQLGLSIKTFGRWMKHLMPAAGKERQNASECSEHRHPFACNPGALGDACGSNELDRNGCSRVCRQLAAFANKPAQMTGPFREHRDGSTGGRIFIRVPAQK